MQIISFLFKKYLKLEKPELRYYYNSPKHKEIVVVDQETGESVKQTIKIDYTVLDSNAVLVRKVFDQDDINFGILIPINGSNEDSFVDPNLLKVFSDIDYDEFDSSSINSFVNSLENYLLPYADNSFNYNYLKEYLESYYRFYQLDLGGQSIDESTFLKSIFSGYIKVVRDFSFVERKPLYLSLLTNVYEAFKDCHISELEESLKPLTENAKKLTEVQEELSQIERFDKLNNTKTDLSNFDELEVKRQIKRLKIKLDNCSAEFDEAMRNNDYNKIKNLLNECSSIDKEICDFADKYSDIYATMKSIKNDNS